MPLLAQRLLCGGRLDGSPAAKGGLRVGDVILSLNGKPIVMSADLPHLVGALKPGSKARMEVVRDGDRKTLDVSIGAMPEEGEAVAASGGGQERSDNRLGVKVTELTEEQKKSKSVEKKQAARFADHGKVEPAIERQIESSRLYAVVASRPGQSGRVDGYILEGEELAFYSRAIRK